MPRSVTYEYYTSQYRGTTVAEDEWDHAALLASAHLERIKALATVTPYGDEDECESMAICAMAEVAMMWEDATTAGGGTTSETIGSVHASYGSAQDLLPGGLGPALMRAAGPWLHICLVVG